MDEQVGKLAYHKPVWGSRSELIGALIAVVTLSSCAPRLTSTQRFIRGEMEYERQYNMAQAQQEARARCRGDIELIPEMAALGGGEEASDYRCAVRRPTSALRKRTK